MELLQEFNRMMENTKDIALATSANNTANVRIVNFYYDTQKKGTLYFSTIRDSAKTIEFLQNNKVAFTTVPVGSSEHARVVDAEVKKSDLTIYNLKDQFIGKYPDYAVTIAQVGNLLDIYEINFKEANVILDITNRGKVIV